MMMIGMIKKQLVNKEVATLLRDKGFNEPCFAYYSEYVDDGKTLKWWKGFRTYDTVKNKNYVLVPFIFTAMEWLRLKHNLFLNVGFGNDINGDFLYMADICDLTKDSVDGRYEPVVKADEYLDTNPKSPAEAINEALKHIIINLI